MITIYLDENENVVKVLGPRGEEDFELEYLKDGNDDLEDDDFWRDFVQTENEIAEIERELD